MELKRFEVRVPLVLYDAVKEYARQNSAPGSKVSMSEVARMALEKMLGVDAPDVKNGGMRPGGFGRQPAGEGEV